MRLSLSLMRVQAMRTQATTKEMQRRIQLLRDMRLGITATHADRREEPRPPRAPRVRQF